MAAEADDDPQFGPYLVYERLGVGGMATVHRALERGIEGFERIVALKRLLPHLAEDASFIKAFVREAKLASALNHVNIVQIFELGRVGTEYFISMEYIDGRDIRRILRHARKVTGPPPINVTVGLLLQLCDALDYAHNKADDQGMPMLLVHRDVSPSNLLVTSAGHVKVIDFGIAKAQSSQLRTQTGRVKGKLAYMAPEAVSGKELDARSDLFAVGVIAHELLTARPLFASKNEYQTLLKVQRGDIMPPSTFNQGCHAELDAIVLRALARDPDQRYASAAELREDLVDLRKQYNLGTGVRDVAAWIEWAFALEIPTGGFAGNTGDQPSISIDVRNATRTPHGSTPAGRPKRGASDIDDAVEIAWGGEHESAEGPIVLDDVPDVSGKHLAPVLEPAGASGQHDAHRLFDDELDDDIPTPVPSHGPAPRTTSTPGATPLPRSSATAIPRERRSTAPGHSPARSTSARHAAQAVDPSSLVDALHAANDAAATLDSMPAISDEDAPADTHPSLLAAATDPMIPPPRMTPVPRATPVPRPTPPTSRGPSRTTPHPTSNPPPVPASRATPVPTSSEPASRASPPSLPVVRFREPSVPPPSELPVGVPLNQQVRTKPGHQPARAATATPIDDEDIPTLAPHSGAPIPLVTRKAAASPAVGTGMVREKSKGPRKSWIILAGIAAAGAVATAVTLYATRGDQVKPVTEDTQPRVAPKTAGTVKFNLEPSDAEIVIGGKLANAGSPFQIELEAGVHQIQINRSGYKSWLTALELSAAETQTLRVVLEPLGSAVSVTEPEATLILSSTPSGLEALLDGKVLPVKTPIKMPIKVGPHTIILRDNGQEVWRQDLVAVPNAEHEFSPSMDATKLRERAERKTAPHRPAAIATDEPLPSVTEAAKEVPVPAPAVAAPAPVAEAAAPTPSPAPAPPATPSITTPKPKPTAAAPAAPTEIAKPAPTTIAKPAAPTIAQPTRTGPMTIPPSKVTKLSGAVPELSKTRHAEIPPVVAAKLCIDQTGAVTSADLITKLEARSALEMVQTLKAWRYTPYKPTGSPTAAAACFAVSFRTK